MRILIIGYGNPSRSDDGVALHVVNALRWRWGQEALHPLNDGWGELGGTRDSLMLQQLTPELAATVAQYGLVILVDAALPASEQAVRVEPVRPGLKLAAISHHMKPGTLLALADQLYGKAPVGWMVSVHGHDFGFGEQLSPETAAAVPEAVKRIEELMAAQQAHPAPGDPLREGHS